MPEKKLFNRGNILIDNSKIPVPVYFENKNWRLISNGIWIGISLLGLLFLLSFGRMVFEQYTSGRNMSRVLVQFLYIVLPAIAVSVIYSNGSIDLSAGAVASLTAALTAVSVNNGTSVHQAILSSVIIALVIGCINGAFSGIFRTAGTLFTLIIAFFLRACVMSLLEGRTIPFNGNISGILTFGWVLFLVLAAGAVLWIQFPGFNIKFAKNTIKKNKLLSLGIMHMGIPYIISSLCAAITGLCFLNYMSAATPMGVMNFEIDLILVLIISGSCLHAGFGNVVGVILAAFILAATRNLMAITNINIFMQNIIFGAMILVGIAFNYGFHAILGLMYRSSMKARY
jgi:ribose/xylose/arabinose/galactoside ABC-type transport system permease subunit